MQTKTTSPLCLRTIPFKQNLQCAESDKWCQQYGRQIFTKEQRTRILCCKGSKGSVTLNRLRSYIPIYFYSFMVVPTYCISCVIILIIIYFVPRLHLRVQCIGVRPRTGREGTEGD
jgi:hypothetical protein